MKLPTKRTKIKNRKLPSWESKCPCYKERKSLAIGLTLITAPPSQPSKLPSISVTSIPKILMQVNCNAGSIKTNRKGEYGRVEARYMPKGIADIFSMNEIEKLHRITYNSIDRYYVVHTGKGPV